MLLIILFMRNKFGILEKDLKKIKERDSKCVYCNKKLIYPYNKKNQRDSATIEHLNFDGPFYTKDGLKLEDIAMCCGSCNSSRGQKKLIDWFKSEYCINKNINANTVAKIVKDYLGRNKNK